MLAVLIATAGLFVVNKPRLVRAAEDAPVSMRDRLAWVALSAIPAGLVIAVTSYISTDIAAAPLLWVLPLALYLLTFVGVFRDRPWIASTTVAMLVPFAVTPLAIAPIGRGQDFLAGMIALNLAAFFLLAMLCHGEVYRRRPAPAQAPPQVRHHQQRPEQRECRHRHRRVHQPPRLPRQRLHILHPQPEGALEHARQDQDQDRQHQLVHGTAGYSEMAKNRTRSAGRGMSRMFVPAGAGEIPR